MRIKETKIERTYIVSVVERDLEANDHKANASFTSDNNINDNAHDISNKIGQFLIFFQVYARRNEPVIKRNNIGNNL